MLKSQDECEFEGLCVWIYQFFLTLLDIRYALSLQCFRPPPPRKKKLSRIFGETTSSLKATEASVL